jgi:hypothetical protein
MSWSTLGQQKMKDEKKSKLPPLQSKPTRIKSALWVVFKEAKIDGRTSLGKTMAFLRKELIQHIGGSPSIPQKILIDRIVNKSIRCHLYEMGVITDPTMGSRDHYLALSNSLRLDLQALGLDKKPGNLPGLEDYLKGKGGGIE